MTKQDERFGLGDERFGPKALCRRGLLDRA